MAASKAQREQAARLLAAGKTESEVAKTTGVGRSTIQGWKRKPDFQSMIEGSKITVQLVHLENDKSTAVEKHVILQSIDALRNDEANIAKRVWALFGKLEAQTLELIEATDLEDLSPRQIPSLIKACCDMAQLGFDLNDRISGMEVIVDGFNQLEKTRALKRQP